MKRIALLVIASIFVISAFSQSNPPKKIRKDFEVRFPGAQEVVWSNNGERQKELIYRAEFTLDGSDMATTYDYKSNWMITIQFIDPEELPPAVKEAISEEYMNAKLLKAAKVEEPEQSSYGVSIHFMDSRMEILFREDGRMLRRRLSSEGFSL
jgi:hypothetical protein